MNQCVENALLEKDIKNNKKGGNHANQKRRTNID